MKPWLARRNDERGRGLLAMVQNELRCEDQDAYRNFLRMNDVCFRTLLNIIGGRITHRDTHLRQCISAEKR